MNSSSFSKTIASFFAVLTLLFLAACETPPPRAVTVQENDSVLLAMWPTSKPIIQKIGVFIDGVQRGTLHRNEFVRIPTPSGRHEVKFRGVGALSIGSPVTKGDFTFEKGKTLKLVHTFEFDLNGVVMIGNAPLLISNTEKSIREIDDASAEKLMYSLTAGEVL